MLRNSSTQALPNSCSPLFGTVRKVPMMAPTISATTQAQAATERVQPQAESIQSR